MQLALGYSSERHAKYSGSQTDIITVKTFFIFACFIQIFLSPLTIIFSVPNPKSYNSTN